MFEVELSLKVATTLTLGIQATPPGFATSSTFTAIEQPVGLPFAIATTLTVTAPPVTVTCPADGLGTMTVDPSSVPAATSMPFTFTYQAGSCGAGAGGTVMVTVPPGWTHPSTTAGTPGFVTWTGTPQVLVLGSMIVVPVGNLEPGTTISFEYQAAQAPGSSVPYTFAAGQAAGGEPSQPLASSPMVMVTASGVTSTTPPAGGGGAATTPPAGGTGTTTPAPAGGTGTTTPAPAGGTGTTTPAPAGGTGTTTPAPAKVTTAHPTIDWPPILLGVIGLILVAGTAGLAAFRPLRRGGHGTAAGNVRAVPHTGPPPSVAVRNTGNRPALTVRIEPRPSATVTTIEEGRP